MVKKKKDDEDELFDITDPFASPTLVFDTYGDTYADCYEFAESVGVRTFQCEANELVIAIQPLNVIEYDQLYKRIPKKWKGTAVVSRSHHNND